MASKSFEAILSRKLGKNMKGRNIPVHLNSVIRAKGLDLQATFKVRASDLVPPELLVEQSFEAASRRIDDILEDQFSLDALDSRFFTRTVRSSKAGEVTIKSQVFGLRDTKGRIMSGMSLSRLLNLVLFRYVKNLMVGERLINRTGRFAHSAMVTGMVGADTLENQSSVSIFFTYMVAPYSIFESTEPWARGGSRDPRTLISLAIQEALKDILNPESYKSNLFKTMEQRI